MVSYITNARLIEDINIGDSEVVTEIEQSKGLGIGGVSHGGVGVGAKIDIGKVGEMTHGGVGEDDEIMDDVGHRIDFAAVSWVSAIGSIIGSSTIVTVGLGSLRASPKPSEA